MLVTGAAGFIGARVKALLAERGADVIAVDHAWNSQEELTDLVGGQPLGACIHLGWYANPRDYLTAEEPNLRSLADSTALVERLAAIGCGHLVVAGSCAEYADASEPLREGSPIGPWSAYGTSKVALREMLERSWRANGLGLTWARLFNLTGPGESAARLVPTVTRALLAGTPVDLSPGQQVRDYLDVDDVASALVQLADCRYDGVVNVCSGEPVSLRRLLGALADRIGRADLLRFGAREYAEHDAMILVGDNSRLRETGWIRSYPFSEMTDRVVAHWKEQSSR
ncbi:MAG: hypothetical protein QOH79_2421 [Acidimicrobiaceae bacterium]